MGRFKKIINKFSNIGVRSPVPTIEKVFSLSASLINLFKTILKLKYIQKVYYAPIQGAHLKTVWPSTGKVKLGIKASTIYLHQIRNPHVMLLRGCSMSIFSVQLLKTRGNSKGLYKNLDNLSLGKILHLSK